MPTYQYVCTECGERTEATQSFTDDALTQCLACEGRLRKVFSAVGVVFKGSGFYKNDSRAANGKRESASGEKSGESGTSADKATGDKPAGDKGAGDNGSGAKGAGDKPAGDRPGGDRPGKPTGDKPGAGGRGASGGSGSGGPAPARTSSTASPGKVAKSA